MERDRMKNAYYSYRRREELKGRTPMTFKQFEKTRLKGPFDASGKYSPKWQRGIGRTKDFWKSGSRADGSGYNGKSFDEAYLKALEDLEKILGKRSKLRRKVKIKKSK